MRQHPQSERPNGQILLVHTNSNNIDALVHLLVRNTLGQLHEYSHTQILSKMMVTSDNCETSESELREELVRAYEAASLKLLMVTLGNWAAVDIQRIYRGYVGRKRVRLRRKRLLFTAMLLQRVTRGGFARRNIKLLRIVLDQPQRKRLVMKYRYLQKGEIVIPRVAAAFILQRFAKRIPSIVRVQHLRDLYMYVVRSAVKIQALAKRAHCRRLHGTTLVEHRRARHEKLLVDYVESQVAVWTLRRVTRQLEQQKFEREVCRGMLTGRSFAESRKHAERSHKPTSVQINSSSPIHRSGFMSRQAEYGDFVNNRLINGLADNDTTDSDDDSIDEELLRPQNKAVKLISSRRRKKANSGTPTPESGWLLRAYPGFFFDEELLRPQNKAVKLAVGCYVRTLALSPRQLDGYLERQVLSASPAHPQKLPEEF
ncbi:Hypothetical protein, putative [Bodo saltans]|uniref:IQ calmodulin-binding protein n=1 Tax=Bodo saltans TaxID=75058 RepID=A0A0S4IVD0_BODSA|nr:Hypothetical protein, putative [Bodo saltans]|eukprot:CUG01527.1 Hypothetical protein, putative [Bodo saltans]